MVIMGNLGSESTISNGLEKTIAEMSAAELICVTVVAAPIIEEIIYTYLPNIVISKFPHNVQRVAKSLPAYAFAVAHKERGFNNYMLISCAMFNYIHSSYLLKRKVNFVPIISHAVNNSIPIAVMLACSYFLK